MAGFAPSDSVPAKLLPPRRAKRKAAPIQRAAKKKRGKSSAVLGALIANLPGALVKDPYTKGSSLQGVVLEARVVERVKKGKQAGKYRLEISGAVPSKGGYTERDDLQLLGKKFVSAATVRRYQRLTEDQAYVYTG